MAVVLISALVWWFQFRSTTVNFEFTVIDTETSEPVDCTVVLFDTKDEGLGRTYLTNDNGQISLKLGEGIYSPQFLCQGYPNHVKFNLLKVREGIRGVSGSFDPKGDTRFEVDGTSIKLLLRKAGKQFL
jgi:hypothetical protein